MRWPWHRDADDPREAAVPRTGGGPSATSRPSAASPAGWAFLPPLQRTIGDAPVISGLDTARYHLAAWGNPSSMQRMSRGVSIDAAAGVVDGDGAGLCTPTTTARPTELTLLSASGDEPQRPAPAVHGGAPGEGASEWSGELERPRQPAGPALSALVSAPVAGLPVLQLVAAEPLPTTDHTGSPGRSNGTAEVTTDAPLLQAAPEGETGGVAVEEPPGRAEPSAVGTKSPSHPTRSDAATYVELPRVQRTTAAQHSVSRPRPAPPAGQRRLGLGAPLPTPPLQRQVTGRAATPKGQTATEGPAADRPARQSPVMNAANVSGSVDSEPELSTATTDPTMPAQVAQRPMPDADAAPSWQKAPGPEAAGTNFLGSEMRGPHVQRTNQPGPVEEPPPQHRPLLRRHHMDPDPALMPALSRLSADDTRGDDTQGDDTLTSSAEDLTPTDLTPTDLTPTDLTPADLTPADLTPTNSTPVHPAPAGPAPEPVQMLPVPDPGHSVSPTALRVTHLAASVQRTSGAARTELPAARRTSSSRGTLQRSVPAALSTLAAFPPRLEPAFAAGEQLVGASPRVRRHDDIEGTEAWVGTRGRETPVVSRVSVAALATPDVRGHRTRSVVDTADSAHGSLSDGGVPSGWAMGGGAHDEGHAQRAGSLSMPWPVAQRSPSDARPHVDRDAMPVVQATQMRHPHRDRASSPHEAAQTPAADVAVQRLADAPDAAAAATPEAALTPPDGSAGSSATGAGGAPSTTTSPEQIEELARRLVGPISRRIKADMLIDRERRGLRTDSR